MRWAGLAALLLALAAVLWTLRPPPDPPVARGVETPARTTPAPNRTVRRTPQPSDPPAAPPTVEVEAPAPPLPTPVPETPVAAADPPPESGELNFHVLDPEGREVEEATVGFTSRADQRHRTDRILRAPQTRWSLAPGTYRGLVTAPGFGEKPFAAEVSPGATTTVRLSLDRGLALAGVLVDDLRKPIAGARVFARSGSNPIRVRTDDEGRFAIGGLQALAYDLRSEPDGCDEAVLSGVVAPRAGLVLMAPRRGAVTALLRVPTGFPIPERVTVFRPASRGSSEMHASSRPWNDGRFELEGVPTGSARGRRRR